MTADVPCGFICGYPTRNGDLYGGNAYGSSLGSGLQAAAQAAATATWGTGPPGREVIAHPVCKGKYQPFHRKTGEKMYGCFRHSAKRAAKIARAGCRPGWVSFDQWPDPNARGLTDDDSRPRPSAMPGPG